MKAHANAYWELNTQRGLERESYGINEWIESPFPPHRPGVAGKYHFPVQKPDQIPLLGDACQFRVSRESGDPVPTNLQIPTPSNGAQGVAEFCIDRHTMAVNIVFLDGHAEHVPLARLWKLDWSPTFVPRDVVVSKK